MNKTGKNHDVMSHNEIDCILAAEGSWFPLLASWPRSWSASRKRPPRLRPFRFRG